MSCLWEILFLQGILSSAVIKSNVTDFFSLHFPKFLPHQIIIYCWPSVTPDLSLTSLRCLLPHVLFITHSQTHLTNVYVFTCVCMCICPCAQRLELTSGTSFDCSPPYVLRQGLSLEPRAPCLTSLASSLLWLFPVPASVLWDCKHAASSDRHLQVLGIWTLFFTPCAKPFIHGTTSLALVAWLWPWMTHDFVLYPEPQYFKHQLRWWRWCQPYLSEYSIS